MKLKYSQAIFEILVSYLRVILYLPTTLDFSGKMNQLLHLVDSLSEQVTRIEREHNLLKAELQKVQQEKKELETQLEAQKNSDTETGEKNKVLTLAKSISEHSKEGNAEIKLKINELVREIDKCIVMLNK